MMIMTDNRFEVIKIAKEALLDSTNIEQSPDEMKVLNDFLHRCWQMGWLDKYESKAWIPCSERLPEERGYYLVTCNGCIDVIRYGNGKWLEWRDYQGFIETDFPVIAWMPLPEPYELKGEASE